MDNAMDSEGGDEILAQGAGVVDPEADSSIVVNEPIENAEEQCSEIEPLNPDEIVVRPLDAGIEESQREDILQNQQQDQGDEQVPPLISPPTGRSGALPGRLDIPEMDAEEMSIKSISDGDNSVLSDNQEIPDNQCELDSKTAIESENESEELDDIELIFTTDETCRDVGLQEDLVSITENETWHQQEQRQQRQQQREHALAIGQPVLLKYTKSAAASDSDCMVNGNDKTSSVEEAVSSQSSSIDREESVDRFDESSSTRLNKMWSQCSVLVETDISKCGVLEESELSTARHAGRRNTLAAPPTAYRYVCCD